MTKRSKSQKVRIPYGHNKNITVSYELQDKNSLIVPGDKILIKRERGSFTFLKLVENTETNVLWIDCTSDKNKDYRSFYVDRLKGKVKPKRVRKKNV